MAAIVAQIPDLSLAFQAQFLAHAHPCDERSGAANASDGEMVAQMTPLSMDDPRPPGPGDDDNLRP